MTDTISQEEIEERYLKAIRMLWKEFNDTFLQNITDNTEDNDDTDNNDRLS